MHIVLTSFNMFAAVLVRAVYMPARVGSTMNGSVGLPTSRKVRGSFAEAFSQALFSDVPGFEHGSNNSLKVFRGRFAEALRRIRGSSAEASHFLVGGRPDKGAQRPRWPGAVEGSSSHGKRNIEKTPCWPGVAVFPVSRAIEQNTIGGSSRNVVEGWRNRPYRCQQACQYILFHSMFAHLLAVNLVQALRAARLPDCAVQAGSGCHQTGHTTARSSSRAESPKFAALLGARPPRALSPLPRPIGFMSGLALKRDVGVASTRLREEERAPRLALGRAPVRRGRGAATQTSLLASLLILSVGGLRLNDGVPSEAQPHLCSRRDVLVIPETDFVRKSVGGGGQIGDSAPGDLRPQAGGAPAADDRGGGAVRRRASRQYR